MRCSNILCLLTLKSGANAYCCGCVAFAIKIFTAFNRIILFISFGDVIQQLQALGNLCSWTTSFFWMYLTGWGQAVLGLIVDKPVRPDVPIPLLKFDSLEYLQAEDSFEVERTFQKISRLICVQFAWFQIKMSFHSKILKKSVNSI